MFYEKLFNNKIFKTCIISTFVVIVFFSCSIPAQAVSEQLSFNVWTLYRNALKFSWVASNGSTSWEYDFTNENDISISNSNVTTIKNTGDLSAYMPDGIYYDYVNNFTLSIPTTRVDPVFYVNTEFLNRPITFNVVFTAEFESGGTYFDTTYTGKIKPYFSFYMGTPDDFDDHWGSVSNLTVKKYTSTQLVIAFDVSVTFTESNYISGFWLSVRTVSDGLLDPGGFKIIYDDVYNVNFNCSYTLSPLTFTNDITAEDIGNAVGDAMIKSEEYVKEEASSTGNDSVNGILDSIPDFTTSWSKNISMLADAFSYDGTDFSMTWPAFTLPSLNINGVNTPPHKVWDEYTIDVEKIVNDVVPDVLLTVARILFTIALSLFCVVEVMDIILGVMTAFQVRIKN